jgi:16S rRNA (guanine527-N7)-methyltransferase
MQPTLTTPADVASHFGVSRETLDRLEVYADLLRHWQKVKNLVAPGTLDVLWSRHIADSLQLLSLAPEARTWVDLGSGAGFPGMVIAIVLGKSVVRRSEPFARSDVSTGAGGQTVGLRPEGGLTPTYDAPIAPIVHLVESNARKCAFLAEVARKARAPVEIHGERIELLVEKRRVESVDIVTARALAPLGKLLGYAYPFLGAHTRCLFPKGRDWAQEIEEARGQWQFDVQLVPSQTDEEGRIAVLSAVKPLQKE